MFGPGNSLVLLFDHLTQESSDEMERQIEAIGEFYRFVPFSELLRSQKRSRKMGVASVVFQNARKSFFLRGRKYLMDKGIVPLICVRPDIQGTNRLPWVDEYRGSERDVFAKRCWKEPKEAEKELREQRERLGPLPLNEMDPTLYLATWGNLVELPLPVYEVGIHVPHLSFEQGALEKDIQFIKKMVGKTPETAFVPSTEESLSARLKAAGIHGMLSLRQGIVDKLTSCYDIPHFIPEPESHTP